MGPHKEPGRKNAAWPGSLLVIAGRRRPLLHLLICTSAMQVVGEKKERQAHPPVSALQEWQRMSKEKARTKSEAVGGSGRHKRLRADDRWARGREKSFERDAHDTLALTVVFISPLSTQLVICGLISWSLSPRRDQN